MLIQVAHKNTQNLKNFNANMTHLGHIIDTLICFNPALVYAKLMSQVEDVADHLDTLIDTVQQLQHQPQPRLHQIQQRQPQVINFFSDEACHHMFYFMSVF